MSKTASHKRAPLFCFMGRHDPDPIARWNDGYYFSRCRRCRSDLVRTSYGRWQIPHGYRVIWRRRDSAASDTLDVARNRVQGHRYGEHSLESALAIEQAPRQAGPSSASQIPDFMDDPIDDAPVASRPVASRLGANRLGDGAARSELPPTSLAPAVKSFALRGVARGSAESRTGRGLAYAAATVSLLILAIFALILTQAGDEVARTARTSLVQG